MDKIKRIKELISMLNEYRKAYYNDSKSLIADYEYDTLFDELQKLENETGVIMANSPTQIVGYEVMSKLSKVKHSHPMLSLDKTKSVSELIDFIDGKDCLLSLKLDGLTVLLTYDNGELVKAETRGNGEEGEDITHNARVFENIPLTIEYKGHLEVEGEAIITYHDFEKINENLPDEEKYKNPRNLASGSVRQLDSGVAAQRHIKFICWKIPSHNNNSFGERLLFAELLGFEVVPYEVINHVNKIDLQIIIERLKNKASEKGYPIDGLVCTYDDVAYGESLGMTGHHPKHSIAFKFYDEEVETTIRDVEFSMGKTGSLTPVAIFDTVEIDGTEVNRASLHNLSILEDLGIGIGDTVTVYKANAIIPQIRDNLTRSCNLEIPDSCPICGGKTEIIKENDSKVLTCTNPNCKGKLLGKLTHAVSKNALNIDGLSESTIEKFIGLGWLSSIKDIYRLHNHAEELAKMEGFGEKSVSKLMLSIAESRKTTLDKFLYAQSIPLIGRTASKDMARACDGEIRYFIDVMDDDDGYFTHIDGFGSEMDKSLKQWWIENRMYFINLQYEFTFESIEESLTKDKLKGNTIVITGSLTHYKNRDELVSVIESMGGKVSGSVSAKTDYLINNDTESQSGKNKKAKELNVPIISEEDFLKMISE